MGDLRIRYGFALGRQNNFYAGVSGQKGYLAGSDGLIASGNTGPNVSFGSIFYTQNTSLTTISKFELSHPSVGGGNLAGLYEGKVFSILTIDSNTTIAGPRIYVSNSSPALNKNSVVTFIYHASAFYEMSRATATS
jgi:hypothetical protein